MQEELEQKSVAISIKAGKLTANLLKKALEKALAEMTKSQKNPKIYKGKQSVKHLVRQGAGVSNIEITDGNIKSFERVARKYGVDFALKKDTTSQPPRYLVFFKSRDADFLIEAITGNLSNMFGDVNTKVATIAGEVGKTPEQWNSGVFSMIHSLSESVIVPIAGLVIAAVLSYELIRMVIDRNNMHDFDTFIFFKWIIKAGIAAYVVSHTFDFIIAIFEVAQTMVQQSAGVIDANASIDISSALASITTELEAKGLGELFALMLETWVVSFAMTVMGALITIILYGRMIEIYIYASVGPLPFATFANHEWGNIGTNYVRGLVALGLQGFLIMVITGIYAILVKSLSLSGGDLHGAIWTCVAYGKTFKEYVPDDFLLHCGSDAPGLLTFLSWLWTKWNLGCGSGQSCGGQCRRWHLWNYYFQKAGKYDLSQFH